MERICGEFQRNLTSKSAPWANIDKRVLQTAILDQLASRYNLEEELSVVGVLPKGSLSRGERVIDGCRFLPPRKAFKARSQTYRLGLHHADTTSKDLLPRYQHSKDGRRLLPRAHTG